MFTFDFAYFFLQAHPNSGKWLTDTVVVFNPKIIVNSPGGMWIHVLLFASFTMLVALRVFDFKRLVLLVQGFVRASSVATLYREESALSSRVSFLLILNFVLMSSLFVWQSAGVLFTNYPAPADVALIAAAIILAYLVKIVATRFLGFLFEVRDAAQEYIYNIMLFNKTIGLILFPIALCLAYAHQIPPIWLVWTGIVSWAIVLFYRFIRLSWIGLSLRKVSIFYIILYLCTLEILPFVVIVKVLV